MLERIHIQNIGIIEDVEIEFDDNLNVLTGETGSGKTLIIDSINLVTGNRVNKNIIRNGQDFAFIEICFNCNIPNISEDGLVILSRQIYSNGKNVCKINGKMATLTQVKQIGDSLIDIHGQHDVTNLLDKSKYIELLDNYIGQDFMKLKEEYVRLLQIRKEIKQKQEELTADPTQRNRKIDLLQYEIEEIEKAELKIGEEEKLIEQKNIFQNSEKIVSNLNDTYTLLSENILQSLNRCCSNIEEIAGFDTDYEAFHNLLQEAYYNLEETKRDVLGKLDGIYYDADEQQKVFDRLDYIFNLKRKYGNTIEEILNYCSTLHQKLDEINASSDLIQKLNKEYEENTYMLFELALKMHNIRVEKAKKIVESVNNELIDLEMPKAKFEILVKFNNNSFEYVSTNDYQFNSFGLDDVEFNICTNVGSKAQSIGKIASGGELSRLTLALKTVFASTYNVPTIIFDEIDTGLSGQACVALAKKFKNISKSHQIILITHHPNIAAIGTNNIFVKKEIVDDVTKSFAKKLDEEEKIIEVARILSGNDKSDIALKHAKELIEEGIG